MLAGFLLSWGVASTVGNYLSGHLVDKFESRKIINGALVILIANFCLLPWTSAHPVTAAIALGIWGAGGWSLMVPQQHRLVKTAPHLAPLLLALNNTATYGGLACSGLLGGIVLLFIDRHFLSLIGAVAIAIALLFAEVAHATIVRRARQEGGSSSARKRDLRRGETHPFPTINEPIKPDPAGHVDQYELPDRFYRVQPSGDPPHVDLRPHSPRLAHRC